MTRYICTNEGQHKLTRLGRFTPQHVELLDRARAERGSFVADMRDHVPASESVHGVELPEGDAQTYAILQPLLQAFGIQRSSSSKSWPAHPRRRDVTDTPDQPAGLPPSTGRLVFRLGHGVGVLKCPRCGRDTRIAEEKLRAALTARLGEVDISRI